MLTVMFVAALSRMNIDWTYWAALAGLMVIIAAVTGMQVLACIGFQQIL